MKKPILSLIGLCLLGALVGFGIGYTREAAALDAHVAHLTSPHEKRDAILTLQRERTSAKRMQSLDKAIASNNYRAFRKALQTGDWLSASELERTLQALEGADNADRLYKLLLNHWTKADPAAALAFAETALEDSNQYQGLCGIFDELARKNPEAAFETWQETRDRLDKPSNAQGSLLSITDGWWITDLDAAMQAIQTVHDESDRHSALNGCFGTSWHNASATDRKRLLDAICVMEEPGTRHHGIHAYAAAWASDQSLNDITTWMETQKFTGKDLANAERGAAESHLAKNPNQAAKWLAERATPDSLSQHLKSVVIHWAGDEPNAAGKWLGQFDASQRTDDATMAYANIISHDDIESAFHWGQRIQDSEQRLKSLTRYAKRWARSDHDAVVEAIAQSNLPAKQQTSLLSTIAP